MRIVYIVTRADAVGGASIHVRDLAIAMRRRGHEVLVLVGGTGPVTQQLDAAGVPFQSLRYLQRTIHPWRDSRALSEITSALRSRQPDLVSAHTAKAGLVGRYACRRLGIPAIYTPHGWAIGQRISRFAAPLFIVAERLAARWSAAIVCVCEQEKRLAIEKRIAAPERLRVIYNGMPDIDPQWHSHPDQHPPRICTVARFEAPKDHTTLLRSLANLQRLDWHLDLVGDGPLQRETEALASRLGLLPRITFHGYLPDPAPVLAQAQIFVLSTRSEAFPRSILEAMRAGLPVVASDVGGVSESVAHEYTGLLVPPNNPQALTGALSRLLGNAALRQLFGTQGRLTYARRFQWETMEARSLDLYLEVLGTIGK